MKILVAEDDPVSRAVLAQILQDHQVTLAEDGLAAWELLDDPKRSFDVVFIDLEMPKIAGFELVRRIHDSLHLKSLTVVLCTAAKDRATVIKAAQFGVKHYLAKPCTESAVLAKLRQISGPPSSPGTRVVGG